MKSCCAVSKTGHFSWKAGNLAKGCELCVRGEKLVLFITGLCGQRCFYCPVSEQKFGKDVVFADEWMIKNPDNPVELFEEAELVRASGVGITGGDPLVDVERCCKYVKLLKKKFGRNFHVHLYTPLLLVDMKRLKLLADAGVDEIRFHPNLDDDSLWHKLSLAKKFNWTVGIEIPVVPGFEKKILKLVDFAVGKIDFLNLNELELSDTAVSHYSLPKEFVAKSDLSYGVNGSELLGRKILKYCSKKGLPAHFCSAKLKDSVQVRKRLERRAVNVALPYEKVTKDGTIVRGCVYLKDSVPSFGYRKQLSDVNKVPLIEVLCAVKKDLVVKGFFGEKNICVDENKLRLIVDVKSLKKFAGRLKELGFFPAVVEEYPTADALEVDLQFI